jgi:zinc transporter ZupT
MLLSCLFIFSFMTLAGAALGLGLSYVLEGDTLSVVSACFQSFSAGTFLFVALEEIIPKELAMPKDKAIKLVLCVLGLLMMAAIKLFDSD